MSLHFKRACLGLNAILLFWGSAASAGPYSSGLNNPTNGFDAPVPGFVGPHGEGRARLLVSGSFQNPDNYVNPLFFNWASVVTSYLPATGVALGWSNTVNVLGAVTGDNFHIASLGDLDAAQLGNSVPVGQITLTFSTPILNLSGSDFVVYENGFGTASSIFGELAYVEVSSDGINYARFPARTLTASLVGPYGSIDPTNVYNLAGKHVNANGNSWGTPFDLSQLLTHSLVTSGLLNLNAINHIRLVDIPGNGSFFDSLASPIYDAWVTWGSGGLDLEAVGVISRRVTFAQWCAFFNLPVADSSQFVDSDGDGVGNLMEYASGRHPLKAEAASVKASYVTLDPLGHLVISFTRDERASGLTIEVQASNDLVIWNTLARSVGGDALLPISLPAANITEILADPIQSIGVLRNVSVADTSIGGTKRFLRLRIFETITP